jgi:hypothetical protein
MAARRCGVDSLGGAVAIDGNAISSSGHERERKLACPSYARFTNRSKASECRQLESQVLRRKPLASRLYSCTLSS